MKRRRVVFAPEALEDLRALYDRLAEVAGPDTAFGYVERLEAHCRGMAEGSERGTRRDDVRPGLRITGFERRVTIAFVVGEDTVTILRLFYGGRDWESVLRR